MDKMVTANKLEMKIQNILRSSPDDDNRECLYDQIILNIAHDVTSIDSAILCLIFSDCDDKIIDPMLRVPNPPTGHTLSSKFSKCIDHAVKLNHSIHDGAMIFRQSAELPNQYSLESWSSRLLPKSINNGNYSNRGSAFNSSLAASAHPGFNKVYFWSNQQVWKFRDGSAFLISEGIK